MKLYDIASQFDEISELVSSGVFAESEVKDTLDSINIEFETKLKNCIFILKSLKNDIDAIDNEIERLKNLKKSKESNHAFFESYIIESMKKAGKLKSDLGIFSVALRKPTKVVNIIDESMIPWHLLEVIPESTRPNKKAINEVIDAGNEVPGAIIEDGKTALLIR